MLIPVHWRVYASLGDNEFMGYSIWVVRDSSYNTNLLFFSRKSEEKSGGMSSLGDLPSLGGDKPEKKTNKGNNDLEKDILAIDKKIADLGFGRP